MLGRGRDQHQPEPWQFDGRAILNASGWILAKTIFEADARRIVAAVNDVLAIPTAALESGFIREILVLGPRSRPATSDPHPIAAADRPIPPECFIPRSPPTERSARGEAAHSRAPARDAPGSADSSRVPNWLVSVRRGARLSRVFD